MRYNSEWLDKLGYAGLIGLAAKLTLSQMLERKEFLTRFKRGAGISLHELLYPLAQGYDSVMLRSDVELGGTDQKFNLLMGRELQRKDGQPPQIVLMTPILEGLDGVQKMSKSLGNAIGIQEPPGEMYGKLMSISDELMWRYWTLLTDLRGSEIARMQEEVASGALHPMQAKKNLAWGIVRDFHSAAEADAAAEGWARQFQQRAVSEDLPVVEVSIGRNRAPAEADLGAVVHVPGVLVDAGLASSKGEANRKLAENAVSVDGERFSGKTMQVEEGDSVALRLGKRSVRVTWVR